MGVWEDPARVAVAGALRRGVFHCAQDDTLDLVAKIAGLCPAGESGCPHTRLARWPKPLFASNFKPKGLDTSAERLPEFAAKDLS
jgi:hypothetical protein